MSQEPRGEASRNPALGRLLGRFSSPSLLSFSLYRPSVPPFLPRVSPAAQLLPQASKGCPLRVTQGFCSPGGCHEEWAERESRDEAMRPGIFLSLAPVPLRQPGWGFAGARPQFWSARTTHRGRQGWGVRGRAGCLAGAFPSGKTPSLLHRPSQKRGERVTYKTRAKTIALRPRTALRHPPLPSWSGELAGEGGSVLPPWPVRGLRLPGEVPASPGLVGGSPENCRPAPFFLLLPLLPHVSSRSPAA